MSAVASEEGGADRTVGEYRKRKSCVEEDTSGDEDENRKSDQFCKKKVKVESHPVTVLDGGMGRELDTRYPDTDFKHIWSAAHLLNQPESVYKCHLSFIKAGAEIITTSNYSCVPSYLDKLNITNKLFDLIRVAGEAAHKAKFGTNVRVAGSMPPYGFSYMGVKIPDKSEIVSNYAKVAQALHPFVDLFLCETMSSVGEAVAVLSGVRAARRDGMLGDRDLPVWLSFSLLDSDAGELHSKESLEVALHTVLDKFPGLIEGLFLNCCAPHAITAALPNMIKIGKEYGVTIYGAYANRFASISKPEEIEEQFMQDAHVRRLRTVLDIPEELYLKEVERWIEFGCNVVGGCCGMGPGYIEKISQFVDNRDTNVSVLSTE